MVTIHSLVLLLMWCQTSLWVLQMFVLCSYCLHNIWHECCPKVGLGHYTFLGFAKVSSLCQMPFPGQQIICLVLYCIQLLFCSVVLRRKLRLCSSFHFWHPSVPPLGNVSTLYLVRCSRTLAYILPMWFRREMPLYISQSLLLPFFFHIGAMAARCQSSEAFLSFHAFWKIEVSQVMPVSPLARMS